MRKVNRFMEYFWLLVAVVSSIWAIYIIATIGWEQGRNWLWFPVIAGAMFGFRRITRVKLEAMANRDKGAS